MSRFWNTLLSELPPSLLDERTLENLEGRNATSNTNRPGIRNMLEDGVLFPDADDKQTETLISRLRSTHAFVPSLRILFENLKVLEPCYSILKRLFGEDLLARHDTIEKCLRKIWDEDAATSLEKSEGILCRIGGGTRYQNFRLIYAQLWMFCLRHYPYLSSISPRIEPAKRKKKPPTAP